MLDLWCGHHCFSIFPDYFILSYFRSIPWKTEWRAFCLTLCTSSMPLAAHQQAPSSRASPALPQWCNAWRTWPEHRDLETPALVVFIQRQTALPRLRNPQSTRQVWFGHSKKKNLNTSKWERTDFLHYDVNITDKTDIPVGIFNPRLWDFYIETKVHYLNYRLLRSHRTD